MLELLMNPIVDAILLVILAFFSYQNRAALPAMTARWRGESVSNTPKQSFLTSIKVSLIGDGKPAQTYDALLKAKIRECRAAEAAAIEEQLAEQNRAAATKSEQGLLAASRAEQNPASSPLVVPAPRATYDDEDTLNSSQSFMAGLESAGDWIEQLVNAFHIIVVGGSRAGKSVLTHEVAERRAKTDDVYVIDVDSRPGMFPSCKSLVGSGDNFEEADRLLLWFDKLIEERRTLRRQGQRRFTPITLVIPELGAVMAGCTSARNLFEEIVRRGAKLGIRLISDVQDNQVKTLKLEGASGLLINLLKVEVRKTVDGKRIATIDGKEYLIPRLTDPEGLGDIEFERRKMLGVSGLESMPNLRSNVHERSEAFKATPHQDAIERAERSAFNVQTDVQAPQEPLNVNVQDAVALAKALTLKSSGATKQEALEQAFGIKKGGGDMWRKASSLFDMALDKSQ